MVWTFTDSPVFFQHFVMHWSTIQLRTWRVIPNLEGWGRRISLHSRDTVQAERLGDEQYWNQRIDQQKIPKYEWQEIWIIHGLYNTVVRITSNVKPEIFARFQFWRASNSVKIRSVKNLLSFKKDGAKIKFVKIECAKKLNAQKFYLLKFPAIRYIHAYCTSFGFPAEWWHSHGVCH